MTRRHFLNLSNGLEALPAVLASGEPWAVCRIQSTTIERRDWWTLFMIDLSADLLLHLALGVECVLHDRGTRRPQSKTCYYAIPLVRYVLHRRWFGAPPIEAWLTGRRGGRAMNALPYFGEVYRELVDGGNAQAGRVRRRLDYFTHYLLADLREVRLVGSCESTEHDGDRALHRALASSLAGRDA